ncbi:MAG: xanthine dehydrogenase family protein subunit M [Sneathiella sp.]|nr:xanthine dehydrogenase family protein subunit M [Sneathiella sp.]
MIPGSFDYHRPQSVSEATAMLADLGEDALIVAGGHSLIPMMKLRMALPEHLIDIQDIADIKSISISGRDVAIGAMVTQADLINSAELQAICPILRETSLQIADPQIRNLGTIGGNVANGDPGNDLPALMQTLDASYILVSNSGTREVKARDFYEAAYFTERSETEILTAIHFTAPPAGHGFSYMKQKRKIGDYATAAAAVIIALKDGTVESASIGLTNVSDTPLYAEQASRLLIGSRLDDATIKSAVEAAKTITDPAEDGRGPKEFRVHLTGVMVERAIRQAIKTAT